MSDLIPIAIQPFMTASLSSIQLPLEDEFESLLGMNGKFRELNRPCQISASNDQDAIITFLKEIGSEFSKQTVRSYRKEIERFYIWCLQVNGKALADMERDDFVEYREFIQNLPPSWCGPRVKKWLSDTTLNPEWRPFVNSLSPKAVDQAQTIINSLMNWLVDAGYLCANVNQGRKKKRLSRSSAATKARSMSLEDYLVIVDTIEAVTDPLLRERWLFLVKMLFNLGPRVFELSSATLDQIKTVYVKGEEIWKLPITGKGKAKADLVFSTDAMNAVNRYRAHLKRQFSTMTDDVPQESEITFFRSHSGSKPITERQVNRVLKAMGAHIMCELTKTDKLTKQLKYVLENLSCHWFRHTLITALLDTGSSLTLAQKIARHKHPSTTAIYDNRDLLDKKHAIDRIYGL